MKNIVKNTLSVIKFGYQKFNLIYQYIKYKLNLTSTFILPREYYVSDNILKKEHKNLFEKYWIFAGLTHEIKENKAWVKKKIGHREILLVHEDGNYYALENVCPHKNMQLCKESKGKGTFVCDYHAWSFNCDGSVKTIPFHDRSYKFNNKQHNYSHMSKFQVEVVGAFIFVKIRKSNVTIQKQFDPAIIESLKLMSKMLQDQYGTFFEVRDFNWKLNFENLRDSLHPPVLHSKTLGKKVDFSAQYEDVPKIYKLLGRISLKYASSFTKDGDNIKGKKGHLDDIIKPSFPNGYYNWLLFPNFHMATPDGGRSYSIEVHNPVGPDKNEISHYVIVNKAHDPDDVFMDEIIEHRLRGLRPVLEEDYEACERVQKAIKFTNREQNVGCYEHHNINIGKLYKKIIS